MSKSKKLKGIASSFVWRLACYLDTASWRAIQTKTNGSGQDSGLGGSVNLLNPVCERRTER